MACAERPDLILLDVMMNHVLEGVEVSQCLQADPDLRGIPVLMVSSITDTPGLELFPLEAPLHIDGWISKPVVPEDPLAKVARALQQ
ncbi:MAG: hypothetical protein GX605_04965 [Chloroflexi bacterium]|nr:hypothetical protein [Chloroflexota bacterium]